MSRFAEIARLLSLVGTRAARAVQAFAPPLTLRAWFWLALPLSVFTSFVVSVGAVMQSSIFSAITADATQGDGFTELSDPLAWIGFGFHPLNLAMGGAIVFLSLRQVTLRGALVATAIWSAVVLTLGDFAGAIALHTFSLQQQIANVVANGIGGVAIAALTGAALVVFRLVTQGLQNKRNLAALLGAMSVVIMGAAVSAGALFGLRYAYQPLPVQFTVVLAPPTDGMWEGALPPDEITLGERRPFDLLPSLPSRGGISLDGADGEMTINWSRQRGGQKYDLSLRFVGDCPFNEIDAVPAGPPAIVRRDVSNVSLVFDGGVHRLRVAPEDQRSFIFRPEGATYFWLDRDEASETKITYFTSPEDRMSMTSSNETTFLVGAYMLDRGTDDSYRPARRQLTVDIDGARSIVGFERPGTVNPGRRLVCHSLRSQTDGGPGVEVPVSNGETYIGVLVTITPAATELAALSGPHETRLEFVGARGWTSITDISSEDLARSSQGSMTMLSAGGNLSSLEVNGEPVSVGPQDRVLARGDFNAAFGEGANLHVSGEARTLWKNTRRLNQTRAESLPTEVTLALITALLAIFGYLARLAWRRLSAMLGWRPQTLVP